MPPLRRLRAEFHGGTHTQTRFEKKKKKLCQHARKWSFPKLSATRANPAESFLAGTTLRFLNLLDFRLSQQRTDSPLIWQERRWEAAGTCLRGLEVYGLILIEERWHSESVVAEKYCCTFLLFENVTSVALLTTPNSDVMFRHSAILVVCSL